MKRNYLAVMALALITLGTGGYLLINQSTNNSSPNTQESKVTDSPQSEVYKQYDGIKGEEYDRLFLANMMAHHQGAIDMANLAISNAKHEELKSLARQIITAQNTEIAKMESWQKMWGYPPSTGEMMMDHSAMVMSDEMAGMSSQLSNKTGDEFDEAFLDLMIEHHTSAIDMAKPGSANAQHQEVKDLSSAIVADQTKEIAQMKQWQKEWGY